MNPTDPLANLADIHLPEPISAWPPAIGWWLLALVVLAFIAGLIRWQIKRYQKSAYRREALAQLAVIKSQARENSSIATATQLSGLLKQVAVTAYGRHQTASLNGTAWLKFLDEKGDTQSFTSGPGKILGDDIYKPHVDIDLEKLFHISQQWIEQQS